MRVFVHALSVVGHLLPPLANDENTFLHFELAGDADKNVASRASTSLVTPGTEANGDQLYKKKLFPPSFNLC